MKKKKKESRQKIITRRRGAKCDVWWTDFRVDGQRIRVKIERCDVMSEEKAMEIAEQVRAKVILGQYEVKKQKPATFLQLAERYEEEIKKGHEYSHMMCRLRSFFGRKLLKDIWKRDLLELRNWLCEQKVMRSKGKKEAFSVDSRLSHATVDRHLALVRHMINMGITWSGEPDSGYDYTTSISDYRNLLFNDDDSRKVRLSEDDRWKILQSCNIHIRPIVFCAMEQAFRRSEIITMKWEQVDLENGIIYVHRRKKKRFVEEEVPLTEAMWNLLREMKQSSKGDSVFPKNNRGEPYTGNGFHCSWKRIRQRAGFRSLRFHDLRKLAPSALIRSGFGVHAAKTLLGHTDIRVTERYIVTDVEALRNALEQSKNHKK